MAIVGERHVGADEHVVLQRNAHPHATLFFSVTLSPTIAPDFDERMVADVAIAADPRTGHHVGERPHTSAGPDLVALDQRGGMKEGAASCQAPLPTTSNGGFTALPLVTDLPVC